METEIIRIDIDNFPAKEAIQFFKNIDPKRRKLARLIKRKYESQYVVEEIEAAGRRIVQELIYDAYDPIRYKRTYNLLHSVLAAKDIDGKEYSASLALYSDPEIAEAEETDGLFSYAAFFELPVEFKTFIPPKATASRPINYRPFFGAWEKLMIKMNDDYAKQSIDTSIMDLMPPEIRK